MTDYPATPTPAPYPLPADREPLLFHEGLLELRHQHAVVEAEGRLELELVPSLRFRFASRMRESPWTSLAMPRS